MLSARCTYLALMGHDLHVTDDGASAARLGVEVLGGEYETSLRYPIVGLAAAPRAWEGRDDLKVIWDQRREDELDGVEAVAQAISAIALSFGQADSRFNQALQELEIARNNQSDAG